MFYILPCLFFRKTAPRYMITSRTSLSAIAYSNSQENKNRLTLIISIVYIFNILFHTTMKLIVFSKDFVMFINSVAVVIRRLVYLPIISIRNQVNFAHNLIYQKNFSIFLSKSLTENSCSTTRPRIMILTLC